jgi:hypothetical protein
MSDDLEFQIVIRDWQAATPSILFQPVGHTVMRANRQRPALGVAVCRSCVQAKNNYAFLHAVQAANSTNLPELLFRIRTSRPQR